MRDGTYSVFGKTIGVSKRGRWQGRAEQNTEQNGDRGLEAGRVKGSLGMS